MELLIDQTEPENGGQTTCLTYPFDSKDIPPKRRSLSELHVVTTQKTILFVVSSAIPSNPTEKLFF
jgi:hypothetical protein